MSTRVTVRLSPDVHGELKQRARQQGESLAAFIRRQLAAVVAQSADGAGRCAKAAGQERHHERNRMNYIFADDPDHIRVVTALRSTGASIYEAHDRFYCEVRSTLRAMGVSRQAGLRRIVDSGAPFSQRLIRPNGASVFVTDAEINRLLSALGGDASAARGAHPPLHQKHGKVCGIPLAIPGGDLWRHVCPSGRQGVAPVVLHRPHSRAAAPWPLRAGDEPRAAALASPGRAGVEGGGARDVQPVFPRLGRRVGWRCDEGGPRRHHRLGPGRPPRLVTDTQPATNKDGGNECDQSQFQPQTLKFLQDLFAPDPVPIVTDPSTGQRVSMSPGLRKIGPRTLSRESPGWMTDSALSRGIVMVDTQA